MEFSRKNIRVGCHVPLQGIFLTQGLNLHLLHCRKILCHYTTQEAPHLYVVVHISSAPPGPLVDGCILFFSFNFYWTIVALQCCVIFCCIVEWTSHTLSLVNFFIQPWLPIIHPPTSHSAISKQMGTTPEFSRWVFQPFSFSPLSFLGPPCFSPTLHMVYRASSPNRTHSTGKGADWFSLRAAP